MTNPPPKVKVLMRSMEEKSVQRRCAVDSCGIRVLSSFFEIAFIQ